MAIKIFSLLMGLFAFALVFMSLQDFYFIDLKERALNFKSVEAVSLEGFELDKSGVLGVFRASAWERFANSEEDIFTNFKAFRQDFNISADTMSLKNSQVFLKKNVLYEDVNNTQIKSWSLEYDRKNNLLSTQDKFEARRGASVLRGDGLRYDLEDKKLVVDGVRAWILE